MNVLYIHSGFLEHPTGIITHIRELAKTLAKNGNHVAVILRGDRDQRFSRDNVEYMVFGTKLGFFSNIRRFKREFDIVHCHDTLSVIPLLPKLDTGIFYTNHSVFADPDFQRSYDEWNPHSKMRLRTRLLCTEARILGNFALRRVDRVIAVSQFVKRKAMDIYGVPESKIIVINNGIDPASFALPGIPKAGVSGRNILILKPGEPRKGLHYLLRAMPEILDQVPDAKLIGAGAEPGGDYGDYIHRIVTDQNILGNVTFTGVIPFERLVTGYISANVVAMPSVYEAFPIVPLEAGITGRPVVASNIEGCSEVIVDGVTGLLVDPKDPHHLAAAVVKLLLNRELRQRMGNNAREYILKRYTWEIIGQKIEDQYSSFLGCGRKGG